MYDKAGTILRVETTIAETQPFKVLRPQDDDRPDAKLAWLPLRKGVADLHRRTQVSQRANDNYLAALAAVDDTTPLADVFDQVARRVTYGGRSARAIRIGDPADLAILKAIARGEFATAGFRNHDLQRILHPSVAKPPERPNDRSRPRSAGRSDSCELTASFARSNARIDTSSPPRAISSPPPSSPCVRPPPSSSSVRPRRIVAQSEGSGE
jgi:hypothetical protein